MVKPGNWISPAIGIALVLAGASARLVLRDVPNFAPVAALALFAGYLFANRRGAVLVPLSVMALSDLVIGGYDLRMMAIVYASLTLPALIGHGLSRRLPMQRGWSACGSTCALVGSSLASSLLFFLTTNLAVWAFGSMYEPSAAGLLHCYERALPFFRYTLAGDLFFSAVLFGGYAVAVAYARPIAVPVETAEQPRSA